MIKQKHQNIRKKPNIAYHNIYFNENTTEITTEHSEFRDVVFEDVVFDNDRFSLILHLDVALYGVTELLLSNTTSSNTTSLNSREQEHTEAMLSTLAAREAKTMAESGVSESGLIDNDNNNNNNDNSNSNTSNNSNTL